VLSVLLNFCAIALLISDIISPPLFPEEPPLSPVGLFFLISLPGILGLSSGRGTFRNCFPLRIESNNAPLPPPVNCSFGGKLFVPFITAGGGGGGGKLFDGGGGGGGLCVVGGGGGTLGEVGGGGGRLFDGGGGGGAFFVGGGVFG